MASCVFVLLRCFAWLVGLLCACMVRRFYGLWRVCLVFFFFALLLCSLPGLLSLYPCVCLLLMLFVFSCSLVLFVSFSLTEVQTKRKGAKVLLLASSLVLLCVPAMRYIRYPFRFLLCPNKALKLSILLRFPIISGGFCRSGVFVSYPFLNSPSHL